MSINSGDECGQVELLSPINTSYDHRPIPFKGSLLWNNLPVYLQQLRSQVARAICQTASRKATGPDEVPAELFKAGETVLDRMHRICVAIWETGEWPEEWTFSTFIPLPKKGDLK